jgi:hypothetical protein
MSFCVGRGLQDNGHGEVVFIDPSYYGEGDPGWGRRGAWNDAREVDAWMSHFDLAARELLTMLASASACV